MFVSVWGGAAIIGIAYGGGWFATAPQAMEAAAPAAPVEQQRIESIAPAVQADSEDAEWAARAGRQGSPSTGSGRRGSAVAGVRASPSTGSGQAFGYCKWGGGTNCVVDGDTFYLNGAKVRIADIDAPETHDYHCRSELELGERAARELQALLNSGAVTMTSIDRDRDVYGRLLRNVRVNGQDVGKTLISAGFARAYASGRRPWC